ncbi:MAG TPA: MYXO-CTERM sorting domain-containing protein [Polyangiales bacterium]
MTLSCSSRGIVAAAALAVGLAVSSPSAQALPPEYLANAAFHPTDPNVLAVRWESGGGGFLISRDGAKTFRAHPAYAFYKYGLVDRVPFRVSGDGKLLVAVSDAYMEDDGSGCSISAKHEDSVGKSWIADIALHPTNPDTTFLANTGSASGAKHVGLWKRDKAGVLTPLGKSEPALEMMNSVIVRGLAVIPRAASMDGLRFVETITRQTYTQGQTVPAISSALRYTDDLGTTWTEHPVPDPDKTNAVVRLLAVTATEPMKVVVSLDVNSGAVDGPDTVLVSSDGGMTFTPYSKELTAASVALLMPNGALLLADSAGEGGLYQADSVGAPLRKIFNEPVKCLALQPGADGKVVMCKSFEIGFLDVAQGKFCGTFQIGDTPGMVQCPSANLDTNADAKRQLCNAWCGPLHYAFAPLCGMYNDKVPECGLVARQTDVTSGWTEPPGDFAAPRCAGYERPVRGDGDAGVGSDAGASVDGGASPADAATPMEAGAGSSDAGGGGSNPDDEDASTDEEPAKKKGGGCHVTAPGAAQGAGWSLALGLLSLVAWRRRRAR